MQSFKREPSKCSYHLIDSSVKWNPFSEITLTFYLANGNSRNLCIDKVLILKDLKFWETIDDLNKTFGTFNPSKIIIYNEFKRHHTTIIVVKH